MSLADQTLQFFPVSARVSVLQARGLRIKGKDGTNDAYTTLQAGRETFRTPVAEKLTEPVWGGSDAAFIFTLPAERQQDGVPLQVRVFHRVPLGADKLLGLAVINVHELRQNGARENPQWFKLFNKTGKADKERGEVLLDIQFLKSSMSVSMIDLSEKSHSRLGKFKDKLRGKKKDGLSDSASAILPSMSQVLTDSEGEMDRETEGETTKNKKKNKLKSLFVPKSNMKRNSLSQSLSSLRSLPDKNSSISSSTSSGLDVESSEGKKKKKFSFLTHKRNGSTDSRTSNHSDVALGTANQNPPPQIDICINSSHVYREETQSEKMQDMDEEEEEAENEEEAEKWRREEELRERLEEEERRRKAKEEQHRKEEEEKERIRREREKEEHRRRIDEEEKERVRKENEIEAQRRRMEEEEKERIRVEKEKEVQKRRIDEEEKERVRMAREKEEQRRKMAEEKERIMMEREKEEERRLMEEEKERIRLEREKEEKTSVAEEEQERERREKKEQRRKLEEEERMRIKREKEDPKRRFEEERKRREEKEAEELRIKMAAENDRKKSEVEEKMRIAEEERKKRAERERLMAEEEKRIEMERLADEKKAREEEERRIVSGKEKQRKEEERVREEKERKRAEMEMTRKEEDQERRNIEMEERKKKKEKQMREEQERLKKEENLLEESVFSQSSDLSRSARISNVKPRVSVSATVSQPSMANTNSFLDNELCAISVEERTVKKGPAPSPPQFMGPDVCSTGVSKQLSHSKEVSKRQAPQPLGMLKTSREVTDEESMDQAGLDQGARKERHQESKILLVSQDDTQVATNPFTCDESMSVKCNKRPAPKPGSGKSVSEDKPKSTSKILTEGTVHHDEKASASDSKNNPPNWKLLSESNDITVKDVKSDLTDDRLGREEHLEDSTKPNAPSGVNRDVCSEPLAGRTDGLLSMESLQKKTRALLPPNKPQRSGDPSMLPQQPSLPNKTDFKQTQANHNNQKDQDNTSITCVKQPAISTSSSTVSSSMFSPLADQSQVVKRYDSETGETGAKSGSGTLPGTNVVSSDAGEVRKQVAPTPAIRQHAVKPLSAAEKQSEMYESRVTDSTQPKPKAVEAVMKGPYSQLTQAELISLALRQQEQISQRDARIQELEHYIDNMLVRVMEEKPSILMSLNAKNKSV